MLFGGVDGKYPSQDGNDIDVVQVKKRAFPLIHLCMERYQRRPPSGGTANRLDAFKMYVQNYFIFKDKLLQHQFWVQFYLPQGAFLQLAEQITVGGSFEQ